MDTAAVLHQVRWLKYLSSKVVGPQLSHLQGIFDHSGWIFPSRSVHYNIPFHRVKDVVELLLITDLEKEVPDMGQAISK